MMAKKTAANAGTAPAVELLGEPNMINVIVARDVGLLILNTGFLLTPAEARKLAYSLTKGANALGATEIVARANSKEAETTAKVNAISKRNNARLKRGQ